MSTLKCDSRVLYLWQLIDRGLGPRLRKPCRVATAKPPLTNTLTTHLTAYPK